MSIKHTLRLHRTYGAQGTNGTLYYNNQKICHTIELTDRNNLRRLSCIPAGTYRLKKHQFSKNGEQIAITNVLGREAIMFHAANDALQDLQGCIAPVTTITGEGKGTESRKALIKLKALVYSLWDMGDEVFIQIS
jgi:calcineurin-like phosphoesterase